MSTIRYCSYLLANFSHYSRSSLKTTHVSCLTAIQDFATNYAFYLSGPHVLFSKAPNKLDPFPMLPIPGVNKSKMFS